MVKSRKTLALILVFTVLSMFALAGCGSKQESDIQAPVKTTRIITDQAGRQVELPLKVERIVTTWRPCTHLAFAVGAQSKLVGVDNGSVQSKFLIGVYPELANLTKVGDKSQGLNIEQVIATDPDVVIVWAGSDAVIKQLETQSIPAVVLIPETKDQMIEATRILGEITGSKQTEEIVKYFEEKTDMVNKRIKDIPKDERPRIFMSGKPGILSSVGKDYYQHYIIEQAGGVNVAAELKGGWQEVSPEQLVAWNPDIMIATEFCREGIAETLKGNPGLQSVAAVKNNELYRFPSNISSLDFPEPASALGIVWLAKTLYPEKFADIDIQQEFDSFYKEFYGKSFTELGGKFDAKGIAKREGRP